MTPFPEPGEQNHYLLDHITLLRNSLKYLTGKDLVDPAIPAIEAAKTIYQAPFIVVSHNASTDPIFTYGNQRALELFEMSWSEFTALPSRQSAEPPNQEEREQLLQEVTRQGFVHNYSGVRISKSGKRFSIEQVTVWNLLDKTHDYQGQAALYSHWRYL